MGRGSGSKKERQQWHHKTTGKYKKIFIRHVEKFGSWRGKKKSLRQAY